MIVTLDGRRLEGDFADGCTLEALLDQVRGADLDDRLVVSVAVNGKSCGQRELDSSLTQPLGNADQVDLQSGDRYTVSADALRGIAGRLAEIGELQPEVADQLNSGDVVDAVGRIGEVVGVWQASCDAIVQCSGLLGRDLTKEVFDGRSVEASLTELVGRLRELRDALEARDMVLLADLIHYELPELCTTWHDLLTGLADRVVTADV